jgi:hypothetical protein
VVDSPEGAKEAYKRLKAAEERYLALLLKALAGETYSPNKLASLADEANARHAEFMAFGGSLLPRRRR